MKPDEACRDYDTESGPAFRIWDAMENREPMTLEALSVHTLIACMMDRAGNTQEVRAAMFPALYEIYLQEYQETADIIRGLKGSE